MSSLQILINNVKNRISPKPIVTKLIRLISSKRRRRIEDNPEIPKNILERYITAHLQPEKGVVYDCKPFKMLLNKDEKYLWCSCGWGHNQPLCDRTHQNQQLPINLKPVLFQVAETKEYWLCNCKQTKNRPFCDGSHRDPQVQEACKLKVVATG